MVKKQDSELKKAVKKTPKKLEEKELKAAVDAPAETPIDTEMQAEAEVSSATEIPDVPDDAEALKVLDKFDFKSFNSGDTVRVYYKIIEGDKTRIQPFQGIVISKRGVGLSQTFMVRRVGADGIGVERIFPFHSPNISKMEVVRKGKTRRAKLYYLRKKKGRAATKVKEAF